MTDAPTRIYAAAKRWAKGHGPEIDWASGDWKASGKYRANPSQEYVRADIADEMLEALKEIERIYYLEGKNAIYRAAHMRGVAERMIGAVEGKAEGNDA